MFKIEFRTTQAELRNDGEIAGVSMQLSEKGYTPLFHSAFLSIASAAGLDPSTFSRSEIFISPEPIILRRVPTEILMGELYFHGDHVFLMKPEQRRLTLAEIYHTSSPPAIDRFCSDVENAIKATVDGRRLRGMRFNWEQLNPMEVGPRRRRVGTPGELQTRPAVYSEQDRVIAQALCENAVREALLKIVRYQKSRAYDVNREHPTDVVNQLMDLGLVRKEYLVLCRDDSTPVVSCPDTSVLTSGSMRCPKCQRSLSEEQVQDIYVATDEARKYTDGSRWMTIWVTILLEELGLSREHIKWNASVGEDEIDIVFTLNGSTVFVELKDREFGLGDAYPFLFRVDRYGADFGIIISTGRVDREVHNLLQATEEQFRTVRPFRPERMFTRRIRCVEGPDVVGNLKGVISEISRSAAIALIQALWDIELEGIDVLRLLQAWMDKVVANVRDARVDQGTRHAGEYVGQQNMERAG